MNVLNQSSGDNYTVFHGDYADVLKGIPDASIDYSIFSPPFASLYTYSNSLRDMGNVRNDAEFFEHFCIPVAELRRVMKPGHNVSFHCMLDAHQQRAGRLHRPERLPWRPDPRISGTWVHLRQRGAHLKDPVTSMQRTKRHWACCTKNSATQRIRAKASWITW